MSKIPTDDAAALLYAARSMHGEYSTADRLRIAALYVGAVVLVNVGFSLSPTIDWLWSLIVGGVLVLRDYAQRRWGHWCLAWWDPLESTCRHASLSIL